MRVFIASKTLALTQAMRRFARKQATKLSKLNQRISQVHIFLDQRAQGTKRNRNSLVKYVVTLPGKTVVIKHKAADMYEAMVDATLKVRRQVRKAKEKKLTKRRR